MVGTRFGFGGRLVSATFEPSPAGLERVSLAWWSSGPDDPTPVFTGSRHRPRTVVVVWETDREGLLVQRQLQLRGDDNYF